MALLVLGIVLLALGCILSGRENWFLAAYSVLMISFMVGLLSAP